MPPQELFMKKRRRSEDDADEDALDGEQVEQDDGRRVLDMDKSKYGVTQSVVVIDKYGKKKVLDNDDNYEGYVPQS